MAAKRPSMKKVSAGLVAVAGMLAVYAGGSAARADDAAELQANIRTAVQHAKSFTTTAIFLNSGIVIRTVFVAPDRYATSTAVDGDSRDVVIVGDTLYQRVNNGPFKKTPVPPEVAAQLKSQFDFTVTSIAPDQSAGGTTYGTFTSLVAAGPPAVTLTCTYEKTTYRPARCWNETLREDFAHYDDPANTVEAPDAPKGAK
jgi:ABC-type glycerol-3-phosphate transport system substrate-binding protein